MVSSENKPNKPLGFEDLFDLDQIQVTTEEGKYIIEFYEEGFEVTYLEKIDDENYKEEGVISPFYEFDEQTYKYVCLKHYRDGFFPEP